MSDMHVSVAREIAAPAAVIYAILSDYHTGHPSVLPPQYFKSLVVEEGGVGAGTVVRVDMEVMGVKQAYRLVVTEPEPGRVLAEADAAAGTATRFVLEPLGNDRTRLTISTTMRTSGGLRGRLERWLNPPIMRRIYSEELERIEAAARR